MCSLASMTELKRKFLLLECLCQQIHYNYVTSYNIDLLLKQKLVKRRYAMIVQETKGERSTVNC